MEAQYWFVRKDRGKRMTLTLSPELEQRYAVTIGTLVDAIAAGHFPAKTPDQPDFSWVQCRFCNPDGLGHGTARERWERKRCDPVLVPLVTLIDPDADIDDAESQ